MSEQRFESAVERQIREAQERGEFDNLPGKGKPIPDIDQPYDELWWVKQLIQREKITFTPPTLALRRELELAWERIATATSEATVRDIVAALNTRIAETNRKPSAGPPSNLSPLDIDRVLAKWRGALAD